MKLPEKAKFRDSQEWPEVAAYYNEIQDIRHNNSATMSYQIKTGKLPWGKMDFGNGQFIAPIWEPNTVPIWGPSHSFYQEGKKKKIDSIVVNK